MSFSAAILAASPLEKAIDHVWAALPGTPFAPGVGEPQGFVVLTNAIIIAVICGIAVYMTFMWAALRAGELNGKAPSGLYNAIETIMQFVRNDVARPVLDKHTDRFMPYLWTAFFFILYCNLFGLLPVKEVIGLSLALGAFLFGGAAANPDAYTYLLSSGIGGSPTGSIWVTAGLALCTAILFIFAGIRENGIKGFLKHLTGGVPLTLPFAPIVALMVVVELIGLLVKPFSLAVRLFANMFSGKILIAVLAGFSATIATQSFLVGGPVTVISAVALLAIMVLKVFVAFLQAYIFTFLSALFIGQQLEHGHDEEHGDGHEHESHSEHAVGASAHGHATPSQAHTAGGAALA